MQVNGLDINKIVGEINSKKTKKNTGAGSFQEMIGEALQDLDNSQAQANKAQVDFINSEIEPHELMVSLNEAELTFKMATVVRNKIIEAYTEVMRMQI